MIGDFSYFTVPLVALATVGVLSLILRWVFSPAKPPPRRPSPGDYGLLVPVATVADPAEAEAVRDRLSGHGVRATTARTSAGVAVLVFPPDVPRARSLLTGSG